MSNQALAEVWNSLAGQRVQMVKVFYDNLFTRYPHYQKLFPQNIDHQMDLMVETMSTVINFSDQINLIRPYLLRVGVAHKHHNLHKDDFRNFAAVFIDTLEQICSDMWEERHRKAFEDIFDDLILPIIEEGLH